MTQAERQKRSKEEIYQAALEEFGKADFEAVTMDSICLNHSISKGMMYHYYANKSELFLACAQEIFRELNDYLRHEAEALEDQPAFEAIKHYFLLRETFFQTRLREKNVFENAVLRPPRHLADQIHALRQPIREENEQFLRRLLSRVELREGVDRDQAVRYLHSVYAVFWAVLEQYHPQNAAPDLHHMLSEAQEILSMVLFGAARPSTSGLSDAILESSGVDTNG